MKTPLFFLTVSVALVVIAIVGAVVIELLFYL
jgi:hypothetical protein